MGFKLLDEIAVRAVANGTNVIDLPIGNRKYHAFYLQYKTTAAQSVIETDITDIRLKINGVVQRNMKPRYVIDKAALHGYTFQNGLIPIYLSEPWIEPYASGELLGWGTNGLNSLQLEVVLSGASSPTLKVISEYEISDEPIGQIVKWKYQTMNVGSTGVLSLFDLPKKDRYMAVHFFENTAADISDIEVEVDDSVVYNVTDTQNSYALARQGLSPVSDVFHVIFNRDLTLGGGLNMTRADGLPVSQFRFDVNFAAANAPEVVYEQLGSPNL